MFYRGVCWHTSPPQGESRSGGRCRAAKWRAFVPAFRSALPVVCAGSDSLMNCGKTPSPVGEGWGGGSEYPAARHCPFTYTTSAQVYVNLTLSLAGRASVRSGKGVSDRIDESKFRFLNGLLPPHQPSPTGEGAERRNGAHLSPPLVRRFPLFAQEATA